MSIETALVHRVKVRRMGAGTRDAHGDRNPTEQSSTTVPARVTPAAATESLDNRDTNRVDYNVLLDAGVIVDGDDLLDWLDAGVTLKANGPGLKVYDGLGREQHVELAAYEIERLA